METIGKIRELLAAVPIVNGEADYAAMHDVVEAADLLEQPRVVVPYFFEWFEKNSAADLGSPGPFVHFIERDRAYIDLLSASLGRKPTNLTVWMVNRLANAATTEEELKQFTNLLELARSHPLATQEVIESATGFLDHQAGR